MYSLKFHIYIYIYIYNMYSLKFHIYILNIIKNSGYKWTPQEVIDLYVL